ncbi:hypothetical protein Hanom_Chr11g01034571 [Helianthus anomalus]
MVQLKLCPLSSVNFFQSVGLVFVSDAFIKSSKPSCLCLISLK